MGMLLRTGVADLLLLILRDVVDVMLDSRLSQVELVRLLHDLSRPVTLLLLVKLVFVLNQLETGLATTEVLVHQTVILLLLLLHHLGEALHETQVRAVLPEVVGEGLARSGGAARVVGSPGVPVVEHGCPASSSAGARKARILTHLGVTDVEPEMSLCTDLAAGRTVEGRQTLLLLCLALPQGVVLDEGHRHQRPPVRMKHGEVPLFHIGLLLGRSLVIPEFVERRTERVAQRCEQRSAAGFVFWHGFG
mmetsp:Transcript_6837/g.11039  ORF Transcript_6837/g.11039 Transcript_6837/m.11039 type:complete len:249 (-) Transcript_6837:1528-2274(-)